MIVGEMRILKTECKPHALPCGCAKRYKVCIRPLTRKENYRDGSPSHDDNLDASKVMLSPKEQAERKRVVQGKGRDTRRPRRYESVSPAVRQLGTSYRLRPARVNSRLRRSTSRNQQGLVTPRHKVRPREEGEPEERGRRPFRRPLMDDASEASTSYRSGPFIGNRSFRYPRTNRGQSPD